MADDRRFIEQVGGHPGSDNPALNEPHQAQAEGFEIDERKERQERHDQLMRQLSAISFNIALVAGELKRIADRIEQED